MRKRRIARYSWGWKQTCMGNAGFTLVEIMAAMAMIAVLAGALYASLNTGFRARKHGEAAIYPVRKACITFNFVCRDISAALPPRGILAGPFTGESEYLSFFTRPMNLADAAPGIIGVEYMLEDSGISGEFVLARHITFNLLSPEVTEPLAEQLCYGVRSFNIRYFCGTHWHDTWDSPMRGDVLPVAVEMSLELAVPDMNDDMENSKTFTRMFMLPCATGPDEEIALQY